MERDQRHAPVATDAPNTDHGAPSPSLFATPSASLGSAMLQRKLSARIQRKTGGTTTKPAAPTQLFDVDAAGDVYAHGPGGAKVGFTRGGKVWMATHGGKHGVALADAHAGTLRVGGAQRTLFEVESATLTAAPADKPDAPAKPDAPPVTTDGATPAAASERKTMKATFGASHAAVLDDGTEVLHKGKEWDPVAPSALPATLSGKLDESARIDLASGEMWVWLSFALRDEPKESARWVPPGAHSKKEVRDRQKAIEAEAKNLPAASDVKAAVDQYVRTIAVISTVEGDFGSRSPGVDIAASLGIFQWAMPKGSSGEAGSMGELFGNLKGRAEAANKKPEADRTAEDKLYIAAWAQCTSHKLDVKGNQITLNGQPATGGQVESEMHEEMAKGSLRTYQLVAAKDWIEQFKSTIVRPGPSADGIVGNGHSDRKNGAEIQLTHGIDSFFVQPNGYATVGSLFSGEHAIATAIMLGVNRPNYVEAALWRALDPTSDPKTRVAALLDRIATALAPPQGTAGAGKPSNKPKSHRPDEILAAGPDAKAAYAELQSLLWPERTLDAAAQAKLEVEFKKQALKLYPASDARKWKREQRFSTVEAAAW